MKLFYALLALMATAGVVLTTFQSVLTWLFRRRGRFFGEGLARQADSHFPRDASTQPEPLVSILKPVCGLEDDLEANLVSFAALRGVRYEVIVSVADANDPALPVIERVRAAHPGAPFRLVIGGDPRLERGNRKVARLIAADAHARGEIVMISDANVRVEPDDVAKTVVAFRDPRVGCVSNLFTGAGARTAGAVVESRYATRDTSWWSRRWWCATSSSIDRSAARRTARSAGTRSGTRSRGQRTRRSSW